MASLAITDLRNSLDFTGQTGFFTAPRVSAELPGQLTKRKDRTLGS
jgi:hypothetical protein